MLESGSLDVVGSCPGISCKSSKSGLEYSKLDSDTFSVALCDQIPGECIDDIKGSGSIKQISFDIVAFARNLVAENDGERNTIKFRVLKSRFTGLTGDAGAATYDIKTTRLKQAGGFDFEDITL